MPLHSGQRATAATPSTDTLNRRTVPSCRGGASSMLRLAQPTGPSWFAGAGLLPTASTLLQRGNAQGKVLTSHRTWAQLSLFPRTPTGPLKK